MTKANSTAAAPLAQGANLRMCRPITRYCSRIQLTAVSDDTPQSPTTVKAGNRGAYEAVTPIWT